MEAAHAVAFWQALRIIMSRRGMFAAMRGGLFATLPFAGGDEVAARAKRKQRRNRRRKKQDKKRKSRVTATCVGPSKDGSGSGSGDGNVRVAQSFTATRSGPLIRTDLEILKGVGTTGDFVLRLSPVDDAGFPTNEVLAEAVVASDDVPEGRSTRTFTFGDPAEVVAGTSYALVLTRPGGGFFIWIGDFNIGCDGLAFFSESQEAPFELLGFELELIFTAVVRT